MRSRGWLLCSCPLLVSPQAGCIPSLRPLFLPGAALCPTPPPPHPQGHSVTPVLLSPVVSLLLPTRLQIVSLSNPPQIT